MAIRIRGPTPADLPVMAELFKVAVQRGRQSLGLPALSTGKARAFAQEYVCGQLRHFQGGIGFVRVAGIDGTPAGFVTVEVHRVPGRKGSPFLSGEVQELHVRPRFRRQGVGNALMRAVERELRRRGCAEATLFTFPAFRGAHAFYRQRGYRLVSVKFQKPLGRARPGRVRP